METILYITILYGVFLAVPLLFFVLYVLFKTSERKKEKLFREETKRKVRELVWEKENSVRTKMMSVTVVQPHRNQRQL